MAGAMLGGGECGPVLSSLDATSWICCCSQISWRRGGREPLPESSQAAARSRASLAAYKYLYNASSPLSPVHQPPPRRPYHPKVHRIYTAPLRCLPASTTSQPSSATSSTACGWRTTPPSPPSPSPAPSSSTSKPPSTSRWCSRPPSITISAARQPCSAPAPSPPRGSRSLAEHRRVHLLQHRCQRPGPPHRLRPNGRAGADAAARPPGQGHSEDRLGGVEEPDLGRRRVF